MAARWRWSAAPCTGSWAPPRRPAISPISRARIDEAEAAQLPPERVLYLVTGSQGEPRAALARIATGDHPNVALGPGDSVIFSSRIIPGNELAIFELHNRLSALGVEVLTEQDHFVHVSGHPARDELAEMYRWVRPQISVPVHGELRHMAEHARLAKSLQVPEAVVIENGQMLRLAPGKAEIIDEVPVGPRASGRPRAGGRRRGLREAAPRHGLRRADRDHAGAGPEGPRRGRARDHSRRPAGRGARADPPGRRRDRAPLQSQTRRRRSPAPSRCAAPPAAPRRAPGAKSPSRGWRLFGCEFRPFLAGGRPRALRTLPRQLFGVHT